MIFFFYIFYTYPLLRIPQLLYLTNMYLVLDGSPDWSSNHLLAKLYRSPKTNAFFRGLTCWKWSRSYFNAELVKTADLPPDRNYLMCYHPHGIISMGLQTSLGMDACNFTETFPGVNRYVATLVASFKIPLFREWILLHGFVSCGSKTLRKILNTPRSSVVLVPGGANEALYSHPGSFKVHILKRKGFCRIALQTGASVVPVIGFGENELYHTLDNESGFVGKALYRVQVFLMKRFSFSFPVMTHLLPRREKIVVVVGKPLGGGKKIEDPSQGDIDELHGMYVKAVEGIWNEYKDEYGKGIEFEKA